ncbi:YjgN family protein [Sphingomonadaceae bacterium G21617-S1]|nr:YjgN family protein [Sphingomonadaceae bacterium G21617-S1]
MDDDQAGSAFRFNGNWREFAPIAFTNLLLIIVTLGIYRFWAKTRERRYLWSRTDFIGDPLEWTGTGKELFIGFVMAVLIFGVPLFLMQLVIQGLIFRGQIWLVVLAGFLFPFALLFVMGMARFRALRYRLSRTHWHGIRGGCDQKGLAYGWSYVWKSVVGGLFFGLMLPWSMIELWNQRWNEMSFGSHSFTAGADYGPLLRRLLICIGLAVLGIAALAIVMSGTVFAQGIAMAVMAGLALILLLLFLIVVFTAYYALFLRLAIGGMTLNRIDFAFTARSGHIARLLLGDLALLVCTLGLGFVFLSYRHWAFFIRHMEASGEVELASLTQSTTEEPKQGEGLLDAFDVGAF